MVKHTLLVFVLLAIAACSANTSGAAATTADGVTKAIYNNDFDDVTSTFDDRLKTQVSRSEVGTLSDKMHVLGAYKGLTYVNGDPVKNEYTYRANFDKGSMSVVLRLDPDGKVGAYRVFMPS